MEIKKNTSKSLISKVTPPTYKNSLLPLNTRALTKPHKIYFHFLLRIAKGNHQASEGEEGGKVALYSAKFAFKAATLISNSSISCP